ncbi:MAG: hypothetical protein JW969_10470 [Spirochaetales bacterium]|nr:hypothetical protein [Spirochaetales bacterium]
MRIKTKIKDRLLILSWIIILAGLITLSLYLNKSVLDLVFLIPAVFLVWIFYLDALPRKHIAVLLMIIQGLTVHLFLPEEVIPALMGFYVAFVPPLITISIINFTTKAKIPAPIIILFSSISGIAGVIGQVIIKYHDEEHLLSLLLVGIIVGYIEGLLILIRYFSKKGKMKGIVKGFFAALAITAGAAIGGAFNISILLLTKEMGPQHGAILPGMVISMSIGILLNELILKRLFKDIELKQSRDPLHVNAFPAFISAAALSAALFSFLLYLARDTSLFSFSMHFSAGTGLPVIELFSGSLGVSTALLFSLLFYYQINNLKAASMNEKEKWKYISSIPRFYCLKHGLFARIKRAMLFYSDITCPEENSGCLQKLRTEVNEVIGVIGQDFKFFHQENGLLYVALCNENYEGKRAWVDRVEIRSKREIDYARAINAYLLAVQNDSQLPPHYLRDLPVSLEAGVEIPAAAMNILKNNFGPVTGRY